MIRHPAYAYRAHRWVRAYVLQDDLVEYLESVEPADVNLETYLLRAADLLIRACIEVEANLAAILRANTYTKVGSLNMDKGHSKVGEVALSSQFSVQFPHWDGSHRQHGSLSACGRTGPDQPLAWYQAYNAVKHDRAEHLVDATFGHLTDAWCGCVADCAVPV